MAISTLNIKDLHISGLSPRIHPNTNKEVMVGFEDDLMAIKSRLCGESSKLRVIPIFGMGGIGKTTLTRNIYDDTLIVEHFHIRAWITVSQNYCKQNFLSSLLSSIEPSNDFLHEKSIDSMVEIVYRRLKGWKYLIVMDDMWHLEVWDDVKRLFSDDHNGSRIILTTRSLSVANHAASYPPHEVHFMDSDQSWNLLQQKIFGDENCPSELEAVGKRIAGSCKGLPLAIVVIAGLLSTVSKSQDSWEAIAENVYQALTTNVEQFAHKVLSLSYNNLPPHLSLCFLYMGLFPEDYEIYAWKLFKLWEAEDFLEPSGSKSSEEQAEEYLDDLVKRSLVLVIKRKTNGKIKSCRVHDLVRELCIRKAEEDKFLLHFTNRLAGEVLPENIKDQHRVCISHSKLYWPENIEGSIIHTFICFHCRKGSDFFLRNTRLLRVLDTVNVPYGGCFRNDDVFELSHLKCLALDNPVLIPPRISKFHNLQTIIIHQGKTFKSYEPYYITLPRQVWSMPQLRHLVSFVFGPLPHPEDDNLPPLASLQTLTEVTDFTCTEKVRKMVPNLKKLGVSYAATWKDNDHYDLQELEQLHQLEKFKLKVHQRFRFRKMLNPAFPKSLRKLTLSGWQRPWEDMVIVSLLPNLEILKLRDYAFRGPKWETAEEGFHQLKFLLIDKSDLQHWITESDHFPSLKCLVLYRCWCLREIPDCFIDIPALELIKIDGNKSLVDSAKRIQEELLELGNNELKVQTGHYNSLTGDIK